MIDGETGADHTAEWESITHFDGGGRAALAAVAAVRAGYGEVAAHYLSFSDWAMDMSCPIVHP